MVARGEAGRALTRAVCSRENPRHSESRVKKLAVSHCPGEISPRKLGICLGRAPESPGSPRGRKQRVGREWEELRGCRGCGESGSEASRQDGGRAPTEGSPPSPLTGSGGGGKTRLDAPDRDQGDQVTKDRVTESCGGVPCCARTNSICKPVRRGQGVEVRTMSRRLTQMRAPLLSPSRPVGWPAPDPRFPAVLCCKGKDAWCRRMACRPRPGCALPTSSTRKRGRLRIASCRG